ncbi:hypothetical protein DICVIV_02446 [Dictyocaulus viviparus]|uniref:Uncharacterized protein n=1 Tax=Dictyocaulus viviparus TaxID=29172 RepID=A0A0D8Y5G6_DICVI|nr:hypothetical protein DICVIV_02446 [Dictyocaulus viviparus]
MSLPPHITPPNGEIKDTLTKTPGKNTRDKKTNDKNAIMLDIPDDDNDTDKTQDEVMVQTLKA